MELDGQEARREYSSPEKSCALAWKDGQYLRGPGKKSRWVEQEWAGGGAREMIPQSTVGEQAQKLGPNALRTPHGLLPLLAATQPLHLLALFFFSWSFFTPLLDILPQPNSYPPCVRVVSNLQPQLILLQEVVFRSQVQKRSVPIS